MKFTIDFSSPTFPQLRSVFSLNFATDSSEVSDRYSWDRQTYRQTDWTNSKSLIQWPACFMRHEICMICNKKTAHFQRKLTTSVNIIHRITNLRLCNSYQDDPPQTDVSTLHTTCAQFKSNNTITNCPLHIIHTNSYLRSGLGTDSTFWRWAKHIDWFILSKSFHTVTGGK